MSESWATRDVSRRGLLAGIAACAANGFVPRVASAGTPALLAAPDRTGLSGGLDFPEGVMAGLPRTDGATLWTRVPAGLLGSPARLALVVSRHEDLRRPELVTTVTARPDRNGCVHVEASGLRPGEQYYYRFAGRDEASGIGAFRTLRPADSQAPVRIGFFTCQSYTEGYYAAHRHLAAEDLDLVVCLGDYVYEAGLPGVRGIDLNPYPQTLGAMRRKYTDYRRDGDLRAMHARHALVPMWDDHEFRNDYDTANWTFPPLSQLDTLLLYRRKRANAWRAWFEHMPIRPIAGDRTRTYRRRRLGRTLELFTQDSRQYRDNQPCGDVLGARLCADADTAGRSMLGPSQKAWLLRGLRGSRARWKLMANANMLMGLAIAEDGTRHSMDSWDGYGAERAEILTAIGAGVRDLVVVTGDEHDAYAGELWDTGYAPGSAAGAQHNPGGARRVGVEFVVPSVTSFTTGDNAGPSAGAAAGAARLRFNPHLRSADLVHHGYAVLEARRDEVLFRYRHVDRTDAAAQAQDGPGFAVARGRPALEAL